MGAGYGIQNASMGLTAASGIMQAGSSIMQGAAANNYYKQMAAAAQSQARLGEMVAQRENEYTALQGAAALRRLNDDNARVMAGQRAALAANGIVGGTGEDLITDSLIAAGKDKSALIYNTTLRQHETTRAAKLNTINLESQAAQYRLAGKNARVSGFMGAGAGLLSSAASVAGQWYDYKGKYNTPALTQKEEQWLSSLKNNPYYRDWSGL